MEEALLCYVCKKIYEEPRLLSCLHSFCTNCLIAKKISGSANGSRQTSFQDDFHSSCSNLESCVSGYESESSSANDLKKPIQKIICPICDSETVLTRGGVHNLTVNFKLENKIIHNKNKLPPCELCSSSAMAFMRCEQCDIFLCALCMDSHMKYRDTAKHRLIQLNTPVAGSNLTYKCKIHSHQDLSYFCCNCTELMCFSCCTSLHSNHRYETVSKAAENYSATIIQALEKAKPVIKESLKAIEIIKFLDSKITNRCNDVEKEIDTFIQDYKEAVEEHGQSLIQELEKIKSSRKQLMYSHLDVLSQKVKCTQTAIEFAEDLTNSTPIELLNVASQLLNRLDVTDESDVTGLSMRVSDCLQFLPEEKTTTTGKYQLFGIISTQIISPKNCTLQTEGLLSCRQHKKASSKLTTKDSDNKILCHGGEKINAELRYKDAIQRQLPVFINDESDGTYILSFTPDTSGSLSLSVMVHGLHIQGSPFNVCVSSLRPHKGVFHCCSFCSSGGSKSAKCGCGCKMPGGYKGCGHGHAGHPGRRHWSCCGNVLQNSECSCPNTYQCSF